VSDPLNLILQNRLLTEEVKRRVDQLAAINTVATTVSQSLDLNRTLQTALQVVLAIVEAEAGGISLIDEEAGEVILRAQHGWAQDFVTKPMRIPLGQGMSGQVIKDDRVIVDNNLDGTEELAVPSFLDEHFRSIVMAPMHARGVIIGILSIMSSKPNSFNNEIIGVLEAIADTVGVALDNARLYETTVEKENSLRAVLHATTDGIIATDQKGRIRLMNQAAQTLFKINGRSLIGTPLREIPIEQRVRDLLLRALSVRSQGENESFEVKLDSEKSLLVTVSPVYVERQVDQDAYDGWVIVLQDVTHLRQSEIARAQFIQAAAHDMRNPLGLTLNSLYLLDTLLADPTPTIKEVITLATRGAERLKALIDDLLNLEQIESGYGIQESEVNIPELVGEVSAEIKPIAEAKHIVYQAEVEPNIPTLVVDRRLLNRALFNYLDNAVKYTSDGGQVKLRAFVQETVLHLEVTDNGPGIPIEDQAKLFERFYRAPETENIPGTGLGLAIVKSVASKNGGSVYVRSGQGQGSTFGMKLPINAR
jgi:two-component system, NtrC family, sensor histidine kinase KinB